MQPCGFLGGGLQGVEGGLCGVQREPCGVIDDTTMNALFSLKAKRLIEHFHLQSAGCSCVTLIN